MHVCEFVQWGDHITSSLQGGELLPEHRGKSLEESKDEYKATNSGQEMEFRESEVSRKERHH